MECRILEPMPGSHETVLGDYRLRRGCLGNKMAGLRYRVAGSDVYRYPGDPGMASRRCTLSYRTLQYVVFILRGSIISITRLFPSCPNSLCTFINTTRNFIRSRPDYLVSALLFLTRNLLLSSQQPMKPPQEPAKGSIPPGIKRTSEAS